MENLAGVRHHLFRLGLDLSGHPRRGARGSAAPACQHAVLRCGSGALFVDEAEGYAVSLAPRMAWSLGSLRWYLRGRFQSAVLGLTTGPFGNRSRYACDHPGLYGAFGDTFSAHATAYVSAGAGSS